LVDNEKMTFGKLIEGLRRAKLLSQEELAFRCGISRETMSLIENDKQKPYLNNFIKIALNLELKPSELFKLVEDKGLLDYLYIETDEMADIRRSEQKDI
jgi:transcriptional regulator with XRE-family HTH domain